MNSGAVCVAMGAIISQANVVDSFTMSLMEAGSLAAIAGGTFALCKGHKKVGIILLYSGIASSVIKILNKHTIVSFFEKKISVLEERLGVKRDIDAMKRWYENILR